MYVKTYDLPTIHAMTKTPGVKAKPTANGSPEQRGYGLFTKNCIGCHGPNRDRITYPKSIDFARFTSVLRSGNGEMPAFSETTLKTDDVAALAAYLKDPAAGEAVSATPAPVQKAAAPTGSPPAGQTRFYGPFGNIFRTENGLPAFSPPWSSIVAYDLNDGSIKWRRPIGTTPGLAEKGIKDTGSSDRPQKWPSGYGRRSAHYWDRAGPDDPGSRQGHWKDALGDAIGWKSRRNPCYLRGSGAAIHRLLCDGRW